jgi:hypothetical protein
MGKYKFKISSIHPVTTGRHISSGWGRRRNFSRSEDAPVFKLGCNGVHLILLVCIFGLAGFYLFEVNSIAKDRFALEKTESDLAEIHEKNMALQLLMSEANSLPSLRDIGFTLGLEEVKNISYIEVKSASPLVLR